MSVESSSPPHTAEHSPTPRAATLFARAPQKRSSHEQLPPGPRLPRLIQGLLFVIWPLGFMEMCRRRHGGIFTLKLPEYGNVYYLSDVELIGEVFGADATVMHAGEANSVLEPVTGPGSVLVLDEDEHLRHRRMLLPPLHGQALQGYAEVICEIADRHIREWPTGKPVGLRPRFQAITLEVITSIIFGETGSTQARELRVLLDRLFDLSVGKLLWFGLIRWLTGEVAPAQIKQARAAVDSLLMVEIERRRREHEGGGMLGLLLDARDEQGTPPSDAEVCDELVTLLLAGHETTATALAWTFERLVRHPQALQTLEGELIEGKSAYLDATLNESLRVRPVVMDVGRRLNQPVELGGFHLPAGGYVLPSIALVHSCDDHYDRPAEFRPERFLDVRPPRSMWFPFGGGPRRCLGAAFAMLEMRLLVPMVLERYTVSAARAKDESARLRGITLVPTRDCEVILGLREDQASAGSERVSPS